MRAFIVVVWFFVYTLIHNVPRLNDEALHFVTKYHQTYDAIEIDKIIYPFIMLFLIFVSTLMSWAKFKNEGLPTSKDPSFMWTVFVSLLNSVIGYIVLPYILILTNYVIDINKVVITFSPFVLALQLIIFTIIADFYNYIVHRFFHTKFMYRYVHKYHHMLRDPYAWGTIYCSPIEHVLFNMVLIALPSICAQFHVVSLVFALIVAIYGTCMDHSGIESKFFEFTSIKHKNHHLYVNEEYGVYFTDYLFGTEHKK